MIRSAEVVFLLQRQDVVNCAREMGYPPEVVTDELVEQVKKGVEWGLECWHEVMKEAIAMAMNG